MTAPAGSGGGDGRDDEANDDEAPPLPPCAMASSDPPPSCSSLFTGLLLLRLRPVVCGRKRAASGTIVPLDIRKAILPSRTQSEGSSCQSIAGGESLKSTSHGPVHAIVLLTTRIRPPPYAGGASFQKPAAILELTEKAALSSGVKARTCSTGTSIWARHCAQNLFLKWL